MEKKTILNFGIFGIIIGIIFGIGVLLYKIKQFETSNNESTLSGWIAIALIAIFSYLYFANFGIYMYLISIIGILLIM